MSRTQLQGGAEKFWKIWVSRVPGLRQIDRHHSTTASLQIGIAIWGVFD